MSVRHERGVLHACPVVYLGMRGRQRVSDPARPPQPALRRDQKGEGTHLDAILARRGNDLTGIELQRGDGMIVLERLEDASSANVPDLYVRTRRTRMSRGENLLTRKDVPG